MLVIKWSASGDVLVGAALRRTGARTRQSPDRSAVDARGNVTVAGVSLSATERRLGDA